MTSKFSQKEQGSAMVVTLLVMAVLTGLGAVLFNVGVNNLQNAGRDRLSGSAMGAAEAGIAEAITYIRINGTAKLTCTLPASSPSCDNDWGFNNQHIGCIPSGPPPCGVRQFTAWVERIQSYNPSSGTKEGIYKIHSVGTAGAGPGKRSIDTNVRTRPLDYPIGIYGHESVRNGGTPDIRKESMFSAGCIGKRSNVAFDTSAPDPAHPELLPAAHSVKWISEANILGLLDTQCSQNEKKNIHTDPPSGPGECNVTYKWDRDGGESSPLGIGGGGPVAGTPCARDAVTNPYGYLDSPNGIGSLFNLATLKSYGYVQPRGLQDSQYAQIRNRAKEQGNFYDCTTSPSIPGGACTAGNLTGFVPLNGATLPNAVAYIKLAPGKEAKFGPGDLVGYGENPAPGYCGSRSLLIVVEGGDLHLNNGVDIIAALFVPDGNMHLNGSASVVGTLYAKTIHFNGTGDFTLKGQCFFDNLPGGLLSVAPVDFAELDR